MEGWREWVTNLRESLSYRKETLEPDWLRWISTFQTGSPMISGDGSLLPTPLYTVPVARSLISIILPALYFKNPYTIVNPMILDSPTATAAAQAMEAYLNYFTSGVIPMKRHVRRAILDALIYNKGYLENKWSYDTENMATKGHGSIHFGALVPPNSPYVERVSPWDTASDPYSMDSLYSARWYGRRTWVPHEFVRFNTGFNEKVRAKFLKPDKVNPTRKTIMDHVESVLTAKIFKKALTTTAADPLEIDMAGLVQLWTIYDRKYDRVMVFSPIVEGFLIDDENPYKHLLGFPVSELTFEYDTDAESKKALIELVIPAQTEMNHICERQHENLRRFSRIIGVEDGALSDGKTGEKKLEQAKDGTILHFNPGRMGGVAELQWANTTQPEWWTMRNAILRDAQFALGIPPTQTGTGHDKFKSATEASLIQRAFDIRIDDLREQVADWMEDVMRTLGGNIQNLLETSRKFRIAGEEREISREDVASEDFRYQVLLSEAAPENEMKRLQKAEAIYQMAAGGDPLMDRKKAILYKLRALGVYAPDEFLAVSEAVPGNIPASPEGGLPPQEGVPSEMTPEEGAPGMTGSIGPLMSLLAAMQGGEPSE